MASVDNTKAEKSIDSTHNLADNWVAKLAVRHQLPVQEWHNNSAPLLGQLDLQPSSLPPSQQLLSQQSTSQPPSSPSPSSPLQQYVCLVISGKLNLAMHVLDEQGQFIAEQPLHAVSATNLVVIANTTQALMYGAGTATFVLLPLTQFCQLLQSEPVLAQSELALNAWAVAMQQHLTHHVTDQPLIKQAQTIKAFAEHDYQAGQQIASDKGVLWLPTAMLRVPHLAIGVKQPDTDVWPVTEQEVTVIKSASYRSLSARQQFWGDDGCERLSQLARYFSAQVLRLVNINNYDNRQQAQQKAQVRKLTVQAASQRLTHLLSANYQVKPNADDALIKASYKLIQSAGWQVVAPKNLDTTDSAKFLQRIADASGLSYRAVKLSGKWWQSDQGRFIAFIAGKPVVLSRNWSGYQCYDPETEQTTQVNTELAEQIDLNAVCFYQKFAAKKLSIKDILLFETASVTTEASLLLVLALLVSGIGMLVPVITSFILNSVIPGADIPLLSVFFIALLFVGGFIVLFQWIQQLFVARTNAKLETPLIAALWDRVLHLPSRVLGGFTSGDLSSRINSLVGFHSFARTFIQSSVFLTVQIVFSFAFMSWVNFELASLAALVSVLAFIITLGFCFWQLKAYSGGEKSTGIVNSFILEVFTGLQKIKGSGAEVSVYAQWAEKYSILKSKSVAAGWVSHYFSGFTALWSALTLAVIYYLVVHLQQAEIVLGSFIAFLSAYATLNASFTQLSSLLMSGSMQLPMLSYVKPLLDHIPETNQGKVAPSHLVGNLQVEGLTLQYPRQAQPAVNQVQLSFTQGQFSAIVGPSGCGKSSLVKMLANLEKPSRGRIFLDDFELQALDKQVIADTIAIVAQDYKLLPGSLFDNIRGATDASLEQVWQAAELACIAAEIKQLPLGLHTIVGGDAQTFSGGQIQRIAIARALVRQPNIIIFDESTSALDNQTQTRIMSNLRTLDASVIFVAHRLNLVKYADQIIVMNQGAVVEMGDWQSLLDKEGLFCQMVAA